MMLLLLAVLSVTPDESMSYGMRKMQEGHLIEAITNFEDALASDRMNDLGRTIAYWNLYTLYYKIQSYREKSGDYLMSFIQSAEDVLNDDRSSGAEYRKQFIEEQDLKRKIEEAKKELDRMWENKKNGKVF